MLAHAAAGGAERKSFLKEVVTTPDASMVIGEPSVLQACRMLTLTRHAASALSARKACQKVPLLLLAHAQQPSDVS